MKAVTKQLAVRSGFREIGVIVKACSKAGNELASGFTVALVRFWIIEPGTRNVELRLPLQQIRLNQFTQQVNNDLVRLLDPCRDLMRNQYFDRAEAAAGAAVSA